MRRLRTVTLKILPSTFSGMYSGKTSTILVSRVKRPSSIAKPAAIAVTVLLIE